MLTTPDNKNLAFNGDSWDLTTDPYYLMITYAYVI